MSEINQMVVIKLLNAISNANVNYSANNKNASGIDSFEFILKNIIGASLYSNTNNSCSSCNNNNLNTLDTILSSLNSNRLGELIPDINVEQYVDNDIPIKNDIQNDSSSKMNEAMLLLNQQLGKKYVWGATGPSSFDCSGLTQYIYKTALGKDIPRTSYDQAEHGKSVKKEDLQVGDLVFFDTMNKGRVSHVGIYVGNNEFIHASNPKDGVKKSSLSGYYDTKYLGARRP